MGRSIAQSPCLVITGPTASGKTSVAIEVAERVNGEILSMDSRQVYRGMDIGTAKATPAERARVPHHGIDLIDPDERYSAGRFAVDARRWIAEVQSRSKISVIVGGTGFFLKALTEPMFAEPELPESRDELRSLLNEKSADELLRWLDALDPESAEKYRTGGGRQRMARALEVALLTGRSLGWWHAHAPPVQTPVAVMTFVLDLPREELYHRINRRVDVMVAQGLADEVRGLVARGYDENSPGLNATGYAEMLPYLNGEYDLATAIDAIRRASRRYARRQLTWFKHQLAPEARWLDAGRPVHQLAEEIVGIWEREASSANRH